MTASDSSNTALETLRGELNRTAVISREFKQFILGWVNAACKWAYDAGVENGRKDRDRGMERALERITESDSAAHSRGLAQTALNEARRG